MKNSKLIVLFKTFEKEEWRRFKEFLASPFFNKREDLLILYQYIAKQAPDFLDKKLSNEIVFKKVYPSQPYDDKQLKYITNYLLKLAERFLVEISVEKDVPLRNNFLLNALVRRRLDKQYTGHLKKVTKTLASNKVNNENYYLYKYQLADISNWHHIFQNKRRYDASLQNAANYLDEFYLLNKLKYSCEMVNRSKVLVDSYDLFFIEEVLGYVEQQSWENNPLIALYLQVFYIIKDKNNEDNFETLKKLLATYDEEIPDSEKKTISLYAVNYCVTKISSNTNRVYYVEECLKLYVTGIEQGFLFTNGILSAWTFKNIIRLALNLKRYDWTENFIQTYYTKLAKEFQEDALHYNLADLAYRRKNYQAAQNRLLQVVYTDVFYSIDSKTMLLKIYYENDEIEALFALIASFSIYLRRNKKIAQNFRETYLNFTSLLQQVLRAKPNKIPLLIEKIKATELLANRSWLLQICEDLK